MNQIAAVLDFFDAFPPLTTRYRRRQHMHIGAAAPLHRVFHHAGVRLLIGVPQEHPPALAALFPRQPAELRGIHMQLGRQPLDSQGHVLFFRVGRSRAHRLLNIGGAKPGPSAFFTRMPHLPLPVSGRSPVHTPVSLRADTPLTITPAGICCKTQQMPQKNRTNPGGSCAFSPFWHTYSIPYFSTFVKCILQLFCDFPLRFLQSMV